MSKQYSFKKQLSIGKQAEESFLQRYPNLVKLDGTGADFKLPTGQLLELKTDSRPSTKTGNLFIERYSSSLKKSPGGPWKSLADGVEVFVYCFSDLVFCFNVNQLVNFLEANLTNFQSRSINNGNYNTFGYLVPIENVAHLQLDLDSILSL
jgi:hypothetical protein